MPGGWFIDTGWFDPGCVSLQGWNVMALNSSAGVPWRANITMDLDHDIFRGFFYHEGKRIYIEFVDQPDE
jgi:hypothetical protein